MGIVSPSRVIVMCGALFLGACSSSGNTGESSSTTNQSATSSTVQTGTSAGPGPSAGPGTTAGTVGALTADAVAAVQEAHTKERTALATYEDVVAKLGDRKPFTKVIESERQHVAAVAKVAADHNIALSTASVSGNAAPPTYAQACAAGVTIEHQVIAMYGELLPKVAAYADITTAFTNLRQSSQDNHLVAFERC